MSQTENQAASVNINGNASVNAKVNGQHCTVKTALIIGASGLVGKQLLTLLLSSPNYNNVVVLARSSLGIDHHKLIEWIIDFEQIEQELLQWPSIKTQFALKSDQKIDDIFCTLGTTIKKAGNKRINSTGCCHGN